MLACVATVSIVLLGFLLLYDIRATVKGMAGAAEAQAIEITMTQIIVTKTVGDGVTIQVPLNITPQGPDETAAAFAQRVRAEVEAFCKGYGD